MTKPLNKYIDHTLLAANATKDDIKKLCEEAIQYNFATVCVNPYWVSYASSLLKGTTIGVTTVIGFPLGATSTKSKVEESIKALHDGANEFDMVINIGELIAGNYDAVLDDMKQVREATKGHILKVILETAYLDKQQIVESCRLAIEADLDFVKTSTGFAKSGATVDDVKLMKETVGDKLQVKAAGGVRSKEDALKMIQAGADRIGTSGGVKIINNQDHKEGY